VGIRDELLACILDAADRNDNSEDQLRRKTPIFSYELQNGGGILEQLL
jgi:hypothetical protein